MYLCVIIRPWEYIILDKINNSFHIKVHNRALGMIQSFLSIFVYEQISVFVCVMSLSASDPSLWTPDDILGTTNELTSKYNAQDSRDEKGEDKVT